ncbi:MAG: hypothetical protein HWD62_00830 [Cyclobacteriaceae bacterium]|nr:MAG: hypothetical protein HWD62_00830 [Cyclobacteriaceae bacterium]
MRGQIPGLTTPSYAPSANASGLRTGPFPFVDDALLIIDGIPFNNNIGNYLNLNTFDFSSISAFSNTNALNFLGGVNSGAFVLTSKTGEGVVEPLLNSVRTQREVGMKYPMHPLDNPTKMVNGISLMRLPTARILEPLIRGSHIRFKRNFSIAW